MAHSRPVRALVHLAGNGAAAALSYVDDVGADGNGSTDGRRYKWRYGPLRIAAPVAAIVGGAVATVRAVTGDMSPIFGVLGPALIAVGVAAIFVFRWMAKRGI